MTKTQEIVGAILQKKFNSAKDLIHESMNEKLGLLLEETLVNFAPTIFESEKNPENCEKDNTPKQ